MLGGAHIRSLFLVCLMLIAASLYANQTVTLNIDISKAELRQDIGSFTDGQKIIVGYTFVESDIQLQLDSLVSLESQVVFEPIYARNYYHKHYDNNVLFKDNGLYVKKLYAQYATDDQQVFLGKFSPDFGKAFNDAAGLWGSLGLPQGYEIYEQLGIGGRVNTRWLRGTQPLTLTASVFMPDTTPLQHSWFVDRYTETPKTNGVESYAIQATSQYKNKFNYYVGYRSIVYVDKPDELGYVLGINGDAEVNGMAVTRLFEYVNLSNHKGVDTIGSYWTYSVRGEKNHRLYAVVYTKYEDSSNQRSQFEVSTGKRFNNNVIWDVGVQYSTGDRDEWYIGSRISVPIQSYSQIMAIKNSNSTDYNQLVNGMSNNHASGTNLVQPSPSQPYSPTPFPGFY